MRFYPKNWILIAAIAVTTLSRAGGIRVMDASAARPTGGAANGTPHNASEAGCSDSDLLHRLEQLSAWRQRVFSETSLEHVLLEHNTANLSYIDRLELVNRVMVDVLLQAIPDNSAPHNTTHVEPPLLAPRKGPAYRRRTTDDENPTSEQQYSESLQVEDQVESHAPDASTESSVLVDMSRKNFNGEALIFGISLPSPVKSKTSTSAGSEIGENNTSVDETNQEEIGGFETATNDHDHDHGTVKNEDNITSVLSKSFLNVRNNSIKSQEESHAPTSKIKLPLMDQNSSYLSVFGKNASLDGKRNSSSAAPQNALYFEGSHEDGLESGLATPVKFSSSVGVNVHGNGAPANLPRDGASLGNKQMGNSGNEKFDFVSTKNSLEGSQIRLPELQVPVNSADRPTIQRNNTIDFPGSISVQLNVSNLEYENTSSCLMKFFLNMNENNTNLTVTQANFDACMTLREQNENSHVSIGWLKEILAKILNFFEQYTGSLSHVLPSRNKMNNFTNSSRAIQFPSSFPELRPPNISSSDSRAIEFPSSIPELRPPNILGSDSRAIEFPSSIPELRPPNISGSDANITIVQETADVEDDNSTSSLEEKNLITNTSENVFGIRVSAADAQNSISGHSRQPKTVSNDAIFREINSRANHTSGDSDGIFLSNYSQESPREGTQKNSTCSVLQNRWNKVEHLRRAVELLLLSVPVSLREMKEASAHPYLEDFIFRPEGRSIFAVMNHCSKCYMKDPLGRCREVLFCKNGATVSSRILG